MDLQTKLHHLITTNAHLSQQLPEPFLNDLGLNIQIADLYKKFEKK